MDPVLLDLARAVVATALGRLGVISRIDQLPATGGAIVLLVTLSDVRRLVLKVADGSNKSVDFQRTGAVMALARAAGVPTPAVLTAGNTEYARRQYLLLEHVNGAGSVSLVTAQRRWQDERGQFLHRWRCR